MSAPWLATLQTATTEDGFNLAVKISRNGVKAIQPSGGIRSDRRPAYAHDTVQLIASAQVIALNFQTVAAANNWWR